MSAPHPRLGSRGRRVIRRAMTRAAICAGLIVTGATVATTFGSSSASAAACSTSSPQSSCTVTASLTLTAGTLALQSSPNLYWGIDATGYDQWASGSGATLSSCNISAGTVTHCTGGAAPTLEVINPASQTGWSLTEYFSGSTLPAGTVIHFDGAGSTTYGYSQLPAAAGADPFASTTPANVCDFGSTCTAATPAATCSDAGLGFVTCPTYPVTMGGSSPTAQVDLYSASSATGIGAICFATGTATAAGCTGGTPDAFYNMGVKATAVAAGSYSVTVNMAVNTGP